MSKFDNYKYYKGEPKNPYQGKDFGKAFWWKVEMYAAQANDDKERDMLSMTMINYLRELHWEGDGQAKGAETPFKRRRSLRHLYVRLKKQSNLYPQIKLEFVTLKRFSDSGQGFLSMRWRMKQDGGMRVADLRKPF